MEQTIIVYLAKLIALFLEPNAFAIAVFMMMAQIYRASNVIELALHVTAEPIIIVCRAEIIVLYREHNAIAIADIMMMV